MSDIEETLEETLPTRVGAGTTDRSRNTSRRYRRWDVTDGSKT